MAETIAILYGMSIAIDIPGYGNHQHIQRNLHKKKLIDIVKNTLENTNSKNIENQIFDLCCSCALNICESFKIW